MITRYGYNNAFLLLGFGGLLIVGALLWTGGVWLWLLVALGIVICCFTLWFFRDPNRIIPAAAEDAAVLLAPADGKIVQIIPIMESEFLQGAAVQVSIFLSPLDVHVNRSPVSGIVEFFRYLPGDYLVAWHPKSSELNEQSRVGVRNTHGKVLFKQITGYLARRIVCEVKTGDTLHSGEKIGMMKFGSRMDIIVPPDTELYVKNGDRVVGGETLLGRLRDGK